MIIINSQRKTIKFITTVKYLLYEDKLNNKIESELEPGKS